MVLHLEDDLFSEPRGDRRSWPAKARSRLLGVLVATLAATGALADVAGDASLVQTLRAGGHVIYFRHAQTDWSQGDDVRTRGDWTSCDPAKIRQLSDEGRATARGVGEAIRALALPVGTVIASPYCRTMETARLFEVGDVQPSDDVMNLRVAEYFGGVAAIVRTARARLATLPAPGTNTIVVAHGNVARESTPVYPGEAEGVVFRPDGDGGFALVARVTPEDWRRLATDHADAE